MTNLERIKTTICNSIYSMTEDKLFEFISEYEEDEETYFPIGTLFTCSKCHELYGDCEAHYSDSAKYKTCKNRYHNYCKLECE